MNGSKGDMKNDMKDLSTLLSPGDSSGRQGDNNSVHSTRDGMDTLHHMCRALHHTAARYLVLLSIHGTLSRIEHILGHKTTLISFTLSCHKKMKLQINNKIKLQKIHKHTATE